MKERGYVFAFSCEVLSTGSIYIGTSPNGQIYRYKDGKTECIPLPKQLIEEPNKPDKINESNKPKEPNEPNKPNEPNEPNKPKNAAAARHLQNLHIFRLSLDASGRVLAGVSGDKCCLLRLDLDSPESTVFLCVGRNVGEAILVLEVLGQVVGLEGKADLLSAESGALGIVHGRQIQAGDQDVAIAGG
jgi:hypothetical protein